MMRAVLDTNALVSGLLSPRGTPAQIIHRWQRGDFLLLTSPALLAELRRVLHYPRIAKANFNSDTFSFTFISFQPPPLLIEKGGRVRGGKAPSQLSLFPLSQDWGQGGGG